MFTISSIVFSLTNELYVTSGTLDTTSGAVRDNKTVGEPDTGAVVVERDDEVDVPGLVVGLVGGGDISDKNNFIILSKLFLSDCVIFDLFISVFKLITTVSFISDTVDLFLIL